MLATSIDAAKKLQMLASMKNTRSSNVAGDSVTSTPVKSENAHCAQSDYRSLAAKSSW